MHTLEIIVQELQHVPPQHLETVYQLVHALTKPPMQDAGSRATALEHVMGAAGMLSNWNEEEWADFEAELKRTRAELFNRPLPDFDEADAA